MRLTAALERWALVQEAIAAGRSIRHFYPKPPSPIVGQDGAIVGWTWVWEFNDGQVGALMEPNVLTLSAQGEMRTVPVSSGMFAAFTAHWRRVWENYG